MHPHGFDPLGTKEAVMARSKEFDSYVAAGWIAGIGCISALITWFTGRMQLGDQLHSWAAGINGTLYIISIVVDFGAPIALICVKARIGLPVALVLLVVMSLPLHAMPS
jgi:hypothetical protein